MGSEWPTDTLPSLAIFSRVKVGRIGTPRRAQTRAQGWDGFGPSPGLAWVNMQPAFPSSLRPPQATPLRPRAALRDPAVSDKSLPSETV